MKILLADKGNRLFVRLVCEIKGLKIDHVESGFKAAALLKEKPDHNILLVGRLHDMTALEFLEGMNKSLLRPRDMAVWAIDKSASCKEGDVERLMSFCLGTPAGFVFADDSEGMSALVSQLKAWKKHYNFIRPKGRLNFKNPRLKSLKSRLII